MVYLMKFHVDGACRGNGRRYAEGAAAACLYQRGGSYKYKVERLPSGPYSEPATNQRAELTGVVIALEWALERYRELATNPYLRVEVRTDSRYAVGCMDEWCHRWRDNGWINSRGNEVANRDLVERALDLQDDIQDFGSVDYFWVPRDQNADPDRHCNEELDGAEVSDSDSDEDYWGF